MWWSSVRGWLAALTDPFVRGRRRVRVRRPGRGPMRVVYEDVIVHETVSLQARVLQRLSRLVFKPLLRVTPLSERTIVRLRRLDRSSTRGRPSPLLTHTMLDLGGVPAESMASRDGPRSQMTILYLHGGAFIAGGLASHRRIGERLAMLTGATLVSADYVQLPEGTVADSVHDAITAYEALLARVEHPEAVVVAGDSAGGYLAMKVAELATRRGLARPAAIVAFSPLLSLDPERDDKPVTRIVKVRDAYLPVRRVPQIRRMWLPEGALIEGEASPLLAADAIDSPTFLVAVEDELLRPEVEAMALLLAERGVTVETHLWRGQVHAFPVLAETLPESRAALQLAAEFALTAVGEQDTPRTTDPDAHVERIDGEIVPEAS